MLIELFHILPKEKKNRPHKYQKSIVQNANSLWLNLPLYRWEYYKIINQVNITLHWRGMGWAHMFWHCLSGSYNSQSVADKGRVKYDRKIHSKTPSWAEQQCALINDIINYPCWVSTLSCSIWISFSFHFSPLPHPNIWSRWRCIMCYWDGGQT